VTKVRKVANPTQHGPPYATVIFAEDYGAVPDCNPDAGGTDNTGPLSDALSESLRTGLPLFLGADGLRYGVAETLNWANQEGINVLGSWRGQGGPTNANTKGPSLWWMGDEAGTLIDARGMNYCVSGLSFACCHKTSLDRVFNIDAPDSSSGLISTEHLFERFRIDGKYGPIQKGFVLGEVGRANNEFHKWRDGVIIGCDYAGIQSLDPSGQIKGLKFINVTFGSWGEIGGYGCVFNRASGTWRDCNFNALDRCLAWFDGSFESCSMENCTGEYCKGWLTGKGVASMKIANCRLNLDKANPTPLPWEEFINGCRRLTIDTCTIEDHTMTDPNYPIIRPGDGGVLVVRNTEFNHPWPFSKDDQSFWRGNLQGVSVNQKNVYMDDGPYWNRNQERCYQQCGQKLHLYTGHYGDDPSMGSFFSYDGSVNGPRLTTNKGFAYLFPGVRKKGDVGGGVLTFLRNEGSNHFGDVPASPAPSWWAYAVTYVDGQGESEPDLCYQQVYNSSPGAFILGIPAGPSGTKSRNIYRGSDPSDPYAFQWVGTLANNTAPTFLDTQASGTVSPPKPGNSLGYGWLVGL